MTKNSVDIDIDDAMLAAARAELGARTLEETVNEALRRAVGAREERVRRSLDALAATELGDRDDAWR